MNNSRKQIVAMIAALSLAGCAAGGVTSPTALKDTPRMCSDAAIFPVMVDKVAVTAGGGRSVPFEIIRPDKAGSYPLVVFSHGANASPDRYYAMLKPLAAAGYIVVAPMHADSEDMQHEEKPSRAAIWTTRGEDIMIGLSMADSIIARLKVADISADMGRVATMGHSYGAFIAQLPAGAIAGLPTGAATDPKVKAVVAYSPPAAFPPMITKEGWSSIAVPSLTITGTTDILPGFVDDWRVHKQSFDYAPQGSRTLWVGDGIDHYFGGVFGREKPADKNSKRLFVRSIATSIAFLNENLKVTGSCTLASPAKGETITKD